MIEATDVQGHSAFVVFHLPHSQLAMRCKRVGGVERGGGRGGGGCTFARCRVLLHVAMYIIPMYCTALLQVSVVNQLLNVTNSPCTGETLVLHGTSPLVSALRRTTGGGDCTGSTTGGGKPCNHYVNSDLQEELTQVMQSLEVERGKRAGREEAVAVALRFLNVEMVHAGAILQTQVRCDYCRAGSHLLGGGVRLVLTRLDKYRS